MVFDQLVLEFRVEELVGGRDEFRSFAFLVRLDYRRFFVLRFTMLTTISM